MNKKDKFVELRQKAEQILKQEGLKVSKKAAYDFEKLVEELNIAHIELEMQNQELQLAYQKLSAEQQKYKDLYLDAPVAYFTLNSTGNILQLNKAAADLLGLPIQQYRFTSIFPYIAEHSKSKFVNSFKHFFLSDKTEYGEITFLDLNKNYIYTKLSALCYFDADINEKLCRITLTDITEIKQFREELKLQEQLKESEEKLKILIDNSFDIVNILDEKGLIISESKATKRILGYEAGGRIGSNAFDYVHADDLQKVKEISATLIQNPNMHVTAEYRLKHENGDWIWMESSGQNFLNDPIINGILLNSRDISARKKAEERLVQEREEFLALLNAIPEPIYVSDFDTFEVLFANETKKKLYGEKVLGDKCFSAFNNGSEQCAFCKNHLLLNNEYETVRWEKFDAIQQKYFLNIDKVILWHNGKKVRFQISFDITEQKIAQQKIDELNKRLEVAMNSGQMAWWEMHYPSGKVEFNELKTKMLGYEAKDFKHYTDFTKLVHPDDYEQMMDSMRAHLEGRMDIYHSEYRVKNSVGEYIWYYDIGTKEKPIDNHFKVTGIVINTTRQKLAQQKLEESETRFKTLSNLTFEGIVLHENGIAVDVNEAFVRLSGYPTHEIIGHNLLTKVIHPDYIQITKTKMVEDFSGAYEILAIKSDGAFIPVELEGRNVDLGGRKIRVVAVRDITERNKARAIIEEQTTKLQKLNDDKDRFMQIMAHDLKNPFNLLIGFSGILLRNFREYDDKNIEDQLKIIHEISNKAYNLLEELLMWSKAQSGNLPFEPMETDLTIVCHDIVSELSPNAGKKNISILCSHDTNQLIMADYLMLKTILRNLVSNAIKFTPKDGKITLSSESDHEKWLTITVEDSGMGIQAHNLDKLFKINQSFTTEGTDGETGTGLGLLLCKEFTDLHGGRIWAESEYGKGARFKFTMPLALKKV